MAEAKKEQAHIIRRPEGWVLGSTKGEDAQSFFNDCMRILSRGPNPIFQEDAKKESYILTDYGKEFILKIEGNTFDNFIEDKAYPQDPVLCAFFMLTSFGSKCASYFEFSYPQSLNAISLPKDFQKFGETQIGTFQYARDCIFEQESRADELKNLRAIQIARSKKQEEENKKQQAKELAAIAVLIQETKKKTELERKVDAKDLHQTKLNLATKQQFLLNLPPSPENGLKQLQLYLATLKINARLDGTEKEIEADKKAFEQLAERLLKEGDPQITPEIIYLRIEYRAEYFKSLIRRNPDHEALLKIKEQIKAEIANASNSADVKIDDAMLNGHLAQLSSIYADAYYRLYTQSNNQEYLSKIRFAYNQTIILLGKKVSTTELTHDEKILLHRAKNWESRLKESSSARKEEEKKHIALRPGMLLGNNDL